MKAAVSIVTMFLVAPMWYYLLYKILQSVHATDVMWLIYWVYVPVGLVVGVADKAIRKDLND